MIRAFTTVGFIGLGVMGSGQSSNLLRKSALPLVVTDLSAAAVESLRSQGAGVAESAAEVAARADVVFTSLPGGPQVVEALLGDGGAFHTAREGTVFVDLSTIPVGLARSLGEEARARGLHFLDAPVTRTRQAAIDGTLSITVGGEEAVFLAAEPLLRTMATDVVHLGPNGAGALLKIVNNMVVFETVVALSEALTVIRRSGLVEPEAAFEALASGSAASFTLENHGRKALLPDVHPEGVFPAAYMRKDLGYVLELASELETTLPQAALAHELLGKVVDGGLGANYHTAVVRVVEEQIG